MDQFEPKISTLKKNNWIYFIPIFSPFILYLLTTILLTSHYPPPPSPTIYGWLLSTTTGRYWLPPSATTNCYWRPYHPPLSTGVRHCCPPYPLPFAIISHHRFPLYALSVDDGHHRPLSPATTALYYLLLPPIIVDCHRNHHSPLYWFFNDSRRMS